MSRSADLRPRRSLSQRRIVRHSPQFSFPLDAKYTQPCRRQAVLMAYLKNVAQ